VTVDHVLEIAANLAKGEYVELEITDTGPGISPETQSRMLDPFFSTKSAGRGLGLWIVHGIVQNLGGSIHVTSELGKGTAFRILLPCSGRPANASIDPVFQTSESQTPAQKITVLVVEDEAALRQAVVKMLRKHGFEVNEVGDGSSAIDILHVRGATIDVILLDMTIPGASCQEVVAQALRVRPDIKIVLTSAYSQEMVRHKISGPQIAAFVRKPYRLAGLAKTLEETVMSESRWPY
jgi:CheY-like chemotaxis protein